MFTAAYMAHIGASILGKWAIETEVRRERAAAFSGLDRGVGNGSFQPNRDLGAAYEMRSARISAMFHSKLILQIESRAQVPAFAGKMGLTAKKTTR